MPIKIKGRALLALTAFGVVSAATVLVTLPSAAEDSAVQRDAYVQAVDDTIDCVEAAGIDATTPSAGPDQSLRFEMTYPEANADSADVAYTDCYATYLADVESRWLEQNAPSSAELAGRRRAIAGCIRETDPNFAERPSADEILAKLRAGKVSLDCQSEIRDAGSF